MIPPWRWATASSPTSSPQFCLRPGAGGHQKDSVTFSPKAQVPSAVITPRKSSLGPTGGMLSLFPPPPLPMLCPTVLCPHLPHCPHPSHAFTSPLCPPPLPCTLYSSPGPLPLLPPSTTPPPLLCAPLQCPPHAPTRHHTSCAGSARSMVDPLG